MSFRRVILREAQKEYRSIIDYLVGVLKSPQAAVDFMNEFEYQLGLVAENPNLHSLSQLPELAALGYRPVFVKSYVALYKVDGDAVVVAHVFHQSQDYARLV